MKYYFLLSLFFISCQSNDPKTTPVKITETINEEQNFLNVNNALIDGSKSYDIDLQNSELFWIGRKIFKSHDGFLKFDYGKIQIKDNTVLSGQFKVDMNTLTVDDIKNERSNRSLVNHLKNEDFFDVEKYPYAYLNIISSEKKTDQEYLFKGDLTIKNITNQIEFSGKINQSDDKYNAQIQLSFDRTLWNIKYASGIGDKAILDEIELQVSIFTK
tara:strand:- start:460 stop:1104 length:645 start_codon:yes stop_codon:yes gene_type:complete